MTVEPETLGYEIIEHAADAVIFADTDGIIRVWNKAATQLFGYTTGDALGTPLDLIIPERLRSAHWLGFRRAMASGITRLGGQPTITRALHKTGKRLYVEMSFAIVRDAGSRAIGSVAIARDATARYDTEKLRRQQSNAS